ncbi:hypothetical protein JL722_15102 [Aureococcus anophagefferens]|nr:hypothetical protein JL722_15102 [Aureococcus anophagefferens]
MLAITGMLFAEVWHPMLAATTNVPAIYGFQATLQQSVILAPVLAGIAAVETASFPGWEPTDFKMKEGAVPGSYANVEGASPWTKDKLSPEEYERKEVVELNNGRLAMLASSASGPRLISSSPTTRDRAPRARHGDERRGAEREAASRVRLADDGLEALVRRFVSAAAAAAGSGAAALVRRFDGAAPAGPAVA